MSDTLIQSGDTTTTDTTMDTTTNPLPLVGDNGAFRPDWHSSLGDMGDIPDNIKNIKDLPTLAKGVMEGQAMIAKHAGTIGELKAQLADATPQGAPDTYAFATKPDGVLDADWNQEQADTWATVMKEQGINDNQATELVAKFSEMIQSESDKTSQAAQEAQATQVQSLKDDWGNRYDENLEKAMTVADKLGLDVNDAAIGDNVTLIKAFAKIGDSVSESVIKGAGAGNTVGIGAVSSSREEARKIVQDASHPMNKAFNNPGHPQHQDAINRVSQLNAEHARSMGG